MTDPIEETLRYITKQFLCTVPMRFFDWSNVADLLRANDDVQSILFARTVGSDLVKKRPIDPVYQQSFLKHLIDRLEDMDCTVLDSIYEAYCGFYCRPDASYCYRHYSFHSKMVTLKESKHIIKCGTTGLRTWQSACALSEWALMNKRLFEGKTILELGSGTGLAGLVVLKGCSARKVLLTDCHDEVLKSLTENIALNSAQDVATVLRLPWEEVDEGACKSIGKLDAVISADTVYDPDLFDGLISAMTHLNSFCDVHEFIFCCTERNRLTLDRFIREATIAKFEFAEETVPEKGEFCWDSTTPVKLYRISKRS